MRDLSIPSEFQKEFDEVYAEELTKSKEHPTLNKIAHILRIRKVLYDYQMKKVSLERTKKEFDKMNVKYDLVST